MNGRLIATEEGDARGIGEVKGFTVFAKVLGASHELADHLKGSCSFLADLRPCTSQSMDWRRSKRRNDRCQSRVIVKLTAFLFKTWLASSSYAVK